MNTFATLKRSLFCATLLLCGLSVAAAQDQSTGASDSGQAASQSQSTAPAASRGIDMGLPSDLPITTDQAILHPTAADYVLSAGDVLSIGIFNETVYVPSIRINFYGNVDLPYLHEVHLAGLTVRDAQDLVAAGLKKAQIYVDPQVLIYVTTSNSDQAIVIGSTGRTAVPILGSRRLIEVLAAAGGLGPTASHVLLISRRGVPDPIVLDLGNTPITSPNAQIPILPGDIITLQAAGVVYVLGAVKTPGVYPLTGNSTTTLMQLAARIGDAQYVAKAHEMRLIRTTNGQRHFVKVDYDAVLKGKNADPILEPGDILYMPTSGFKAAMTSGGLQSALSFVNLALLAYQITRY